MKKIFGTDKNILYFYHCEILLQENEEAAIKMNIFQIYLSFKLLVIVNKQLNKWIIDF